MVMGKIVSNSFQKFPTLGQDKCRQEQTNFFLKIISHTIFYKKTKMRALWSKHEKHGFFQKSPAQSQKRTFLKCPFSENEVLLKSNFAARLTLQNDIYVLLLQCYYGL